MTGQNFRERGDDRLGRARYVYGRIGEENWMNKRRGRPKTEVARTRRLETRINEEDYNDLLFLCNKTGMSKSDLLRKALREYIDRLKKWY